MDFRYLGCGDTSQYEVDFYPLDISPYGVVGMAGNQIEFIYDYLDWEYYSSSLLVDPMGATSGTYFVARGSRANDPLDEFRLTYRRGGSSGGGFRDFSIRCVMDYTRF
jgi:hypothetical protein